MEIIIHHTNFKSSKFLDNFVKEKVGQLLHINSSIIKVEIHLTTQKKEFSCTIILSIKGNDITTKRTTEDMHYAILKAVDAAKKSLRKKKTIRLNNKQKKSPVKP